MLGGLFAELGDLDAARREIDRAESALSGAGVPAYVAAVQVHRGQLDLARAAVAKGQGHVKEAVRVRGDAAARLVVKRPPEALDDPVGKTLLDCSDDVRFGGARILERNLASNGRQLRRAPSWSERRHAWLSIGSCAASIFTRRGPIRLILDALFRHRIDHPGTALHQQSLLRAGWPGERVQPDAGSKRVRVAVSTLRRLGLDAVLGRDDDGYLLDPRRRGQASISRGETSRTM